MAVFGVAHPEEEGEPAAFVKPATTIRTLKKGKFKGQKRRQFMAPHFHLIEFGHPKKGGGMVPANPFFGRAIKESRPQVARRIQKGVKKVLFGGRKWR
jgi:hypothetical protein